MKHYFENSDIIKGNKAAGVEYYLKPSGDIAIAVVVINKTAKGIQIIASYDDIKTVGEVKKLVKNLPVVLNIDGKGILHKKAIISNNENYIEKVFPNTSNGQFYIQEYDVSGSEIFVSLSRKDVIDTIIGEFTANELKVTGIYLGPFLTELLSPVSSITTAIYEIQFNGNKISTLEKNENTESSLIHYNGIEITNRHIIAFAGALSYFSPYSVSGSNIEIDELKKDFLYFRYYSVGLLMSICFIFSVLFVNFFIFEHFNEKENALQQQLSFNSELSKKLESLKSEFTLKQDMLRKSGVLQKTKISYFIDQLILVMPANVRLRGISYQPVGQKIKSNEGINFSTGKINISGVALSTLEVNKWLNRLKELSWVLDVAIVNYAQENVSGPGEFTLLITYKP